jgi:hypothetical protein
MEIGRRTLRLLTTLLIVVVLLLVTTLLTEIGLHFPALDFPSEVLGVATVLLVVGFVAAPGIAFLIRSIRHRDQGARRGLRYSATASAIPPGLLRFMHIPVETNELDASISRDRPELQCPL